MQQKDKKTILQHGVFWLFMFLFVLDYHFEIDNITTAVRDSLLEIASYSVIVYLNLLFLIPILWAKNKRWPYILALVAFIGVYILMMRITGLEQHFYLYDGLRNVISMVLNTSLFLLLSFVFWYFTELQKAKERALIIEAEKLALEVQFLRSQINPHFIFNTLNNIYSLALQKHENAALMVAKLAALLRHILNEENQGHVLLQKELDTIRSFLDLQLMRKPISTNIDLYIEGDAQQCKILSMLLVNLAENCFKHSDIEINENAFIKISCEICDDCRFVFITENSCLATSTLDNNMGIGLKNAQRQLQLEYANNHKLTVSQSEDVFMLHLELQLS